MRLYRFIARYAGQRMVLDVNGVNDDEAINNFITKLNEGGGSWNKESIYDPSKIFLTYEEMNDVTKPRVIDSSKDGFGIQMEPKIS